MRGLEPDDRTIELSLQGYTAAEMSDESAAERTGRAGAASASRSGCERMKMAEAPGV